MSDQLKTLLASRTDCAMRAIAPKKPKKIYRAALDISPGNAEVEHLLATPFDWPWPPW